MSTAHTTTAQQGTSADICTPLNEEAARAVSAMRRRLSKWELDHLRTHCAELAERLDTAHDRIAELESEVSRAWNAVESWRDDAWALSEDLQEAGKTIGLTLDGQLVLVEEQGGGA